MANGAPKKWSLEYYRMKFGDFTVTHADHGSNFQPWRKLSEVLPSEMDGINLRNIFPEEVVFDCEDEATKIRAVKGLKEKNYGFVLWKTGSRGYHVHMFFPGLKEFEEDVVKEVKANYIEQYGSDPKMKESRRVIAAEYKPHFKTGKPKELIEEYGDPENNIISAKVLSEVFIKIQKEIASNISAVNITQQSTKMSGGMPKNRWGEMTYAHCREVGRKHKLPPGNRHSVFLKNMAIGAFEFESPEYAEGVLEDICLAQGMRKDEYKGWYEGAKNGKYRHFNQIEMQQYLLNNKLPHYRPDNLTKHVISEGEIYQCEDNQYWIWNPKLKRWDFITNFVFNVIKKYTEYNKVTYDVEICFARGYILQEKITMEELSSPSLFKKWLYKAGIGTVIYAKGKAKGYVMELLLEFFRQKTEEAKEDIEESVIQADIEALLISGFNKKRIGIDGIESGYGSAEATVGKRPHGKDHVVLFPTPLIKFFKTQGLEVSSARNLLDLLRNTLHCKCESATARMGDRVVSGWKAPAKIFFGMMKKDEGGGDDIDDGTDTVAMAAAKAFDKALKDMQEDNLMDEDEANMVYGMLENEGYFKHDKNEDVRKYLQEQGGIPF